MPQHHDPKVQETIDKFLEEANDILLRVAQNARLVEAEAVGQCLAEIEELVQECAADHFESEPNGTQSLDFDEDLHELNGALNPDDVDRHLADDEDDETF